MRELRARLMELDAALQPSAPGAIAQPRAGDADAPSRGFALPRAHRV